MKITINERVVDFDPVSITYEEVVALAETTGTPYVSYRSKRDQEIRRRGTMHPGCSPVQITDVMIFFVTHTGAA